MHPVDQVQQLMLKGKYEQARKISEKHMEKDPTDIRMQFNYSWHLLNAGKLPQGQQLMDVGRTIGVYGDQKPILPPSMIYFSEKHDLEGKTVLFVTEGGYGDEMIHIRFVETIIERGASVIICCSEQVQCLFERIPGVKQVITRNRVVDVLKLIDYWIPSFSAAWLLGFESDTLPTKPYLTSHPTIVKAWKENFLTTDKPLKVGIRWEGNPQFEHQQFRRFPVEELLKLSKHEDVQLYSLQLGDYQLRLPDEVINLQQYLNSWEDTAAVIEQLDLVISSCTSVAHLAAAMGKETWVLVPILPYHTWLPMSFGNGRKTPWHPTARLFRQTKYTNWHAPFKQLHTEFAEWIVEKLPVD